MHEAEPGTHTLPCAGIREHQHFLKSCIVFLLAIAKLQHINCHTYRTVQLVTLLVVNDMLPRKYSTNYILILCLFKFTTIQNNLKCCA